MKFAPRTPAKSADFSANLSLKNPAKFDFFVRDLSNFCPPKNENVPQKFSQGDKYVPQWSNPSSNRVECDVTWCHALHIGVPNKEVAATLVSRGHWACKWRGAIKKPPLFSCHSHLLAIPDEVSATVVTSITGKLPFHPPNLHSHLLTPQHFSKPKWKPNT